METRKKFKVLKTWNIILGFVIVVGLILMTNSACNGDRYRLAQQEFKLLVFFCMIVITANVSHRLLYTMKKTTKYGIATLISLLLMLMIFILNNFLHYIGFVSMLGESKCADLSMFQFCLEDLRYMNYIGLYRYVGIPVFAMTFFYVIESRKYRLITNPIKRANNLIINKLAIVVNKYTEDDNNDE